MKAADSGLTASLYGAGTAPLAWTEGWTFAAGGQVVTFQRTGEACPATIMRVDRGGGHYVLRRQPGR